MATVDKRTIEKYHIELTMMMENTGRAVAEQSRKMLGSLEQRPILVMAGKGNNGGGGLASARHLHNRGADVEVILSCHRDELRELPAKQFQILEEMGLRTLRNSKDLEVSKYELIIDSLLGYSQRGNPRGRVAELVTAANMSGKLILALDVPTGLNPDSGKPNNPCIRATHTLTLALPKKGLLAEDAKDYVGIVFVADISVPRKIYRELGMTDSLFSGNEIFSLPN
jgi:NAD(P)H-hydrate epimerase